MMRKISGDKFCYLVNFVLCLNYCLHTKMVINVYYWSFVVAVIFRHAISGHPFIKPLCIVIICIEMSAQILVVLPTMLLSN